MNKLRWLAMLMGVVILMISGFQVYWLKDNYNREKKAIDTRANSLFHETVRLVQDSLLGGKLEIVLKDSSVKTGLEKKIFLQPFKKPLPDQFHPARVINVISKKMRSDSLSKLHSGKPEVFITLNENSHYRKKDSTGIVRVGFDSSHPEDISEVVVVKRNGKAGNPKTAVDSLTVSGRSRNKITGISETGNKDSDSDISSHVNTIFINNEKGERFKIEMDSFLNDSIPVPVLAAVFSKTLKQEKLDLPFTILRQAEEIPEKEEDEFIRRPMFGSFAGYKLQLGNTVPYLMKEISLPILFSFFLVGITIFSFFLLYRSLLRQHRLAQIKNDLISNITHELKTPIATVGVAIEALKNFNAIQDPQKTREYLDISQNELQRLGLLVDKVLKLSMFEKKEIEVKYEPFDLEETVNEVVASLRLQIEKYNARVVVTSEGDTHLKGDRLHLLSVVFNLLDNALKYSKENAAIQVTLKEEPGNIVMKVTDNGIGIPPAYKERIFEKFFRVPTGDTHNAKGHGLGLSYIGQVVRQHKGSIGVDSHEGIGSTFTITLPKNLKLPFPEGVDKTK